MPSRSHRKPATSTQAHAIEVARENKRAPGFVSVYANDVQVQTTPWDMRLVLGAVDEPATSEKPVMGITQLADVRFSLQLAKRLIEIMGEQIVAYESRFGRIPSAEALQNHEVSEQ